jgi:transporter family protein
MILEKMISIYNDYSMPCLSRNFIYLACFTIVMKNMDSWILFAILSLLMYGLWAFFSKVTHRYVDAKSAWFYYMLGVLIVAAVAGVIALATGRFHLEYAPMGIVFGILIGLTAALGSLFFIMALTKGKLSVVTLFVALYPLVTLLLAFLLLKEAITLKQGIGMLFALAALALFSL